MKVLITGTSQGIGKAIAERFLKEKHTVIGIDRQASSIADGNYTHYQCDVRDYGNLPELSGINVLVNNAGTQNEQDIDVNLKALIHITEKYGIQKDIHSILNIGLFKVYSAGFFVLSFFFLLYYIHRYELPQIWSALEYFHH